LKERKGKDSTNITRMNGEDGGNGGKDRLENENMRVNSTCRFRTVEKGTLDGSNSEDCETRRHQAGCKEQLENDELSWEKTLRVCTEVAMSGETYEHPMYTLFGSLLDVV
jgi:hypothetical protein